MYKRNEELPIFLQGTPPKIYLYLMARLGCSRSLAEESAVKVQVLFGDEYKVEIVPIENTIIKTEGFYIEIQR